MVKFQVTEEDRASFPEWHTGQWVLYMPGKREYHFRDTEAEIDELMKALSDINELMRTKR